MFHFTSLPHTTLRKDVDGYCAYSMKAYRLAHMLSQVDVPFILYGPDVHDNLPGNYVTVTTEQDRKDWFGSPEWNRDLVFNRWDVNDVIWRTFNKKVASSIRKNWTPGDVLGIISGTCQASLVETLSDLSPLVVEWGIGYQGVLNQSHKVFESYSWLHHVAGLLRNDNINYFDTVIPNCFDTNDLKFSATSGAYLLYMGRPTQRKGLDILREIAKRTDIPLKIAGQLGFDIPEAEYVGLVLGKEKAELLSGALAVLVPTTYLEPFGGVAVEAMLSGSPVISTDFGGMTETVQQGISGYRCKTLAEFMSAANKVQYLDREIVRSYAESKYSLPVGAQMYKGYFDKIDALKSDGWYTLP